LRLPELDAREQIGPGAWTRNVAIWLKFAYLEQQRVAHFSWLSIGVVILVVELIIEFVSYTIIIFTLEKDILSSHVLAAEGCAAENGLKNSGSASISSRT